VRGDRGRLAQVLGNLLENALQFTPPGGRVSLDLDIGAVGTEDGLAVLEIRDTGIGIDPALLPGLFDRFAEADRTPAGKRGGLGLGLTVARGLVELHGGTLTAASPGVGQGATFTLRLARVPEPQARRGGADERARPTHPLRVVIIEDDLDSAESLGLLLQLLGHEVTVTYTGPRGVAAVREKRPDVVLCDLGLPEMDGFEVARALRADPATAGCPLVAITGYGEEEDRRQAAAAGFEHHLVKPVDPDRLFELLARYAVASEAGGAERR
jgi:two-component system CheB/CheR fusion protein